MRIDWLAVTLVGGAAIAAFVLFYESVLRSRRNFKAVANYGKLLASIGRDSSQEKIREVMAAGRAARFTDDKIRNDLDVARGRL